MKVYILTYNGINKANQYKEPYSVINANLDIIRESKDFQSQSRHSMFTIDIY